MRRILAGSIGLALGLGAGRGAAQDVRWNPPTPAGTSPPTVTLGPPTVALGPPRAAGVPPQSGRVVRAKMRQIDRRGHARQRSSVAPAAAVWRFARCPYRHAACASGDPFIGHSWPIARD